ncbi:hypothetical protein V8D89_001707 [Ganoderma adspersum]
MFKISQACYGACTGTPAERRGQRQHSAAFRFLSNPTSTGPAHPRRHPAMTPFDTSSESHRAQKRACLAASVSPVALAELVNVTVDDQLGDRTTGLLPEYTPNDGTWHVGSPSENCSSCKITPATFDLSQIHDQTWHDATHSPGLAPATVTVRFNGSAVYVYNVLPNTLAKTTTFVNISFALDGAPAGSFARPPDASSTILYNQLVYRNVGLEDGPHTLVMSAGGTSKSLFLFDYLLYSTQGNGSTTINGGPVSTAASDPSSSSSTGTPTNLAQSSSPSSSSTPVGAIVGGVVGGAVILLGILAVVLLLRRRTMRSRPVRIEARARTTGYRHGEGSENDGFLISPSSIFPPSEPSMSTRSVDGPFASTGTSVGTRNFPSYALDSSEFELASGAGSRPSPDPMALHPPIAVARPIPNFATGNFAAAAGPAESESLAPSADSDVDRWSSKRRAELTLRLENLQRTRSILSSSEPPYGSSGPTEYSVGSGTQRAMGELEAEIAELRVALVALTARLADSAAGDERERGPRESLPAYAE